MGLGDFELKAFSGLGRFGGCFVAGLALLSVS